nr:MAG TPA: hypothetical protein [Caudoviricetes sp.]
MDLVFLGMLIQVLYVFANWTERLLLYSMNS